MGTNQKEDSPVKTVRRVVKVTLMGCDGVFRGIDASRMLTIMKEVESRNGDVSACQS